VQQRPLSAGGGSVHTQGMLSRSESQTGGLLPRPMSARGAFPSPTLDKMRRSVTPTLSQLQSSTAAGHAQSKSLKVYAVPSAGVRAGELPQRPVQRPPSAGALKVSCGFR
jgi:hypothetical protein